jgi:hypothetical protein
MSESLPTVYVGPSSTKLGLSQYHLYSELPEAVVQAQADNPALNVLLLPLDVFQTLKSDIYAGNAPSVNHAITQLQADGVL